MVLRRDGYSLMVPSFFFGLPGSIHASKVFFTHRRDVPLYHSMWAQGEGEGRSEAAPPFF